MVYAVRLRNWARRPLSMPCPDHWPAGQPDLIGLTQEAVDIAERSADDFALGFALATMGVALVERNAAAADRGLQLLRQVREMSGSLPRDGDIAGLRGAHEVGRGDALTAAGFYRRRSNRPQLRLLELRRKTTWFR